MQRVLHLHFEERMTRVEPLRNPRAAANQPLARCPHILSRLLRLALPLLHRLALPLPLPRWSSAPLPPPPVSTTCPRPPAPPEEEAALPRHEHTHTSRRTDGEQGRPPTRAGTRMGSRGAHPHEQASESSIRRWISAPAGSAAGTEGVGGEGQRPASVAGLEAARILPMQ
jgi:hypothetical protein